MAAESRSLELNKSDGDSSNDALKVAHSRGYEVRGEPPVNGCLQCLTCTSCQRGGCSSQAPAQVVVTQDGVVQRVNLLIRVQACVWQEDTGLCDTIPPELEAAVPRDEMWKHLNALSDIGHLRSSACRRFWCCLGCGVGNAEIVLWNEALVEWQRRFNAEVLQQRGMAVKTQSHCDVQHTKNGKHRVTERWIAFAMNPTEAQRLLREPHLTGDIDRGNYLLFQGVDEAGLVLHP